MRYFVVYSITVILLLLLSCSGPAPKPPIPPEEEAGKIIVVLRFPSSEINTKAIPNETGYFEVTLQRQGKEGWRHEDFEREGGETQTATFTVWPGTHRIDVAAKNFCGEEEPGSRFLAFGTTNVTVRRGETVSATITLYPIGHNFTGTATQTIGSTTTTLSFLISVPTHSAEDFLDFDSWLGGSSVV